MKGDRHRPMVKICGVTTVEDALISASCGADLIGLNFYPPSPRCVDLARSQAIVEALRVEAPQIKVVGVFVNAERGELAHIDQTLGLDFVQYHGDETANDVSGNATRCIRALRLRDGELNEEALAPWQGCWAILLDAPHAALYGGSGQSWEFGRAGRLAAARRLILAGGLNPDNVGEVLRTVPGVWGLDLCSGIESAPGHKDHDALKRLFRAIDAVALDKPSPGCAAPSSC